MMRFAPLLLTVLFLPAPALAVPATPEDRLSTVFQALEANRLDEALGRVDALIRDYPNFRLAHLVRGDLLLARARPLQTFGNVVKTVPQERIEGLREEALARLRALRERPAEDRLPRYVLQLHAGQKHVLVVDSRRSRLYVFRTSGTAGLAARAMASGCTACPRMSTAGRRARATAASCSPTPTSNRWDARCRSARRR